MKIQTKTLLLSMAMAFALPMAAHAAHGGGTGAALAYQAPGKIGAVIVNPYGIAPLTAVIDNGGYQLKNAVVRIVPKKDGQEIKYQVSDAQLLTHGGIPVFGMYGDYVNTIEVEYDRIQNGSKTEHIKEQYRIYTPPVHVQIGQAMMPHMKGNPAKNNHGFIGVKVKKVDPGFQDRLYLVNFTGAITARNAMVIWNNPQGGALDWDHEANRVAIVDTKGEIRWYLDVPEHMLEFGNPWRLGNMMGFMQNKDGALSWGFGQRYVKYDIIGREVFDRRLPRNYIDHSHDLDAADNGHYFLRVAAANYKRADGRNVRTVRDVIAEVDQNGNVVDEWRLADILDPYRDDVLKAMDQGAVCLSVDSTKSGQTMSAEDLAKQDAGGNFGDIPGVGAGRNWLHVNSVHYDADDDSIVVSARHQSAVIKIGRDKKVKWILSSPQGWKKDLIGKVLTPVDAKGKPIKCEGSTCEGDFDWVWTQHSAFKITEKSDGRYYYLSVFDNGDSRGMEQPAMPSMKYSRAVVYKIDQKKMTVEQIWEYGKERGNEWYSPITSFCRYTADKNSVMVFSATAGGFGGEFPLHPTINEFKWGAKEPSVEISFTPAVGYRAQPFDLKKAFSQ